jgi:hypothetical protein
MVAMEEALNLEGYIKKVYTVAFRLTGDETKATNLAFKAISRTNIQQAKEFCLETFMISAKEVCRLFLLDNENIVFKSFERTRYSNCFQEALMSIKPLRRVLVVWSDVLGLSVLETNFTELTKYELYYELNLGRKQIKDLLSKLNETGA